MVRITKKQYAEDEKQALARWRALPEANRRTETQAFLFADKIHRESGVHYKIVENWIIRHERNQGRSLKKE
jgi:hypothetical protein